MDQELQFLINTLYGNKLNKKQLSNILQMALSDPQYLDLMRNAARTKMPGSKLDMSNIRANNIASLRTPTLGRIDFNHFTANKGIAKNDMSAVGDFKQAFKTARQGGHETFFWKKTKANPSGMFSTDLAPEQTPKQAQITAKLNMDKVDALMPKAPTFSPNYQFDVNAANTELRELKRLNPHNNMSMRPYLQQGGTISSDEYAKNLITRALNNDPEALQEIEQIMLAAQLGDPKAISIAQSILKIIEAMEQQSGVKAKLGTKLNYINKLKGNCPEGEELVYMKQGGRVCPKCIKKARGGTLAPKKEEKKNPVLDFKAKRKKLDPKTTKNLPNGKYPSDWDGNDRMIWEREHGSRDEGAHVVKNKGIKKNLCGGKTKKK